MLERLKGHVTLRCLSDGRRRPSVLFCAQTERSRANSYFRFHYGVFVEPKSGVKSGQILDPILPQKPPIIAIFLEMILYVERAKQNMILLLDHIIIIIIHVSFHHPSDEGE